MVELCLVFDQRAFASVLLSWVLGQPHCSVEEDPNLEMVPRGSESQQVMKTPEAVQGGNLAEVRCLCVGQSPCNRRPDFAMSRSQER